MFALINKTIILIHCLTAYFNSFVPPQLAVAN